MPAGGAFHTLPPSGVLILSFCAWTLRTAAGIDRRTFENRYRQRFEPMEELFLQYEGAGLAVRTEGGWRLTPKGFLVSNSIIAALQEALGQQKAARLAAAAEGDFRVV